MAEVLGTVVGVVSLGLQVCAGVNTYLEGVQCRKEDLEHTTRCCKSMEALLKQIESLQNHISATSVNKTPMEEAMAAAKAELSVLDDFVGEICSDNTSSSPKSTMERIKAHQKKFLYPFRKDHLHRLNDRLETSNRALHSALQLAELCVVNMMNPYKSPADHVFREYSIKHDQALQGLQTGLDSLTRGVSSMHLGMQMSVCQYHLDTTASHSALVNIEKNSDRTTAMLATNHKNTMSIKEDLAEMRTMLAALTSHDGRAILPKLVSKPDALRKISDVEKKGGSDDVPDSLARYPGEPYSESRVYAEFQCNCNPRRVSKSRRRRIGPAFMEQKRVTDNLHGPCCPFSCFNAQSNEKWRFGLSVKALRGVLHAALTISMSAAFGAGGFGLSPSFAYFPVRENSPALEALDLLRAAFYERTWSDEEADLLFRRCIKTLQATIMARKWSPLDIDRRGRSLLRIIAGSRSRSAWQGYQIKILVFLLNAGVPRDRPDNDGT